MQNCNDKTATTKTLANDIYVGTSQALAIDGIRVRQEGSEELSVLNTNQIWIYTSSESIDIRIKVGD